MPGFAQGALKNKLSILYFLNYIAIDVTREQIHRAIVENNCMNYFEYCSAMFELEEDGLIAAIPRPFGQAYRMTIKGKECLDQFENQILFSTKVSLSAFADATRNDMRSETQISSAMEELKDGAYRVTLSAVERNDILLKIEMKLASRNMALEMRRNWDQASEKIYDDLFRHLLKRDC